MTGDINNRELSAALKDMGYDVPDFVLGSYTKRKIEQIAGWAIYCRRKDKSRGRPRHFPVELARFMRIKRLQ